MADDNVKLGSMEIEIVTNAKKATSDIQSMSKTGMFALGALGGVVGALGTGFLGFANTFVRSMPSVNVQLSKYATALEIIAMNTDRAMNAGKGETPADALLDYVKDKTLGDVLEDVVTGGGLSRERAEDEERKRQQDIYNRFITPDPFIGPALPSKSLADLERDATSSAYLGGTLGTEPYSILSQQAGYQQGTPGHNMINPVDASGFGGGTGFGQGTSPVINVFLDGKMLDSQPAYFGR